jgi:DNA-directed RNA polymerase alpha subunit
MTDEQAERLIAAVERIAEALTYTPTQPKNEQKPESRIGFSGTVLTSRAIFVLRRCGITTWEELRNTPDETLLKQKNCGEITVRQLRRATQSAGF